MQLKHLCAALTVASIAVFSSAQTAQAFCGVIQESASARTTDKALRRADKAVRKAVRVLQRQHGSKLVLDEGSRSCIGGALAIDANGVETEGQPSCTLTQPFCVNP
jgi:hypothetical protein